MKSQTLPVDEKIMNELLSQPDVSKHVLKMTPAELTMFKQLLVTQGTYARYVEECKKKRKRH
jgi:hypothetical protein